MLRVWQHANTAALRRQGRRLSRNGTQVNGLGLFHQNVVLFTRIRELCLAGIGHQAAERVPERPHEEQCLGRSGLLRRQVQCGQLDTALRMRGDFRDLHPPKIFSNGLRMGFVVVPTHLVSHFQETIVRFGSKASAMPQRPLALFMRDGEYYRHIRRVRRIYSKRRHVLIELLSTHLGELTSFDDHHAGMHIAIELPDHLHDNAVAEAAERSVVSCTLLSSYCVGPRPGNGLALGFCAYTPDEMQSAMVHGRAIDSVAN